MTDDVSEQVRCEVAWLMWCLSQGYVNAEDRDIMTNWLLDDPATLHRDDRAARPHLLAMADQVIASVRQSSGTARARSK